MSHEANKAVLRTLADAFNTRRLDDFVACFAPDFVLYTATTPDWPRGLVGARQMATRMLDVAPDMHATIEDLIAEDDRVVVRWTFRGTPASPPDSTTPPTAVTAVAISIYRLVAGRIVEDWGVDAFWPSNDAWQVGAG